MKIEKRTSGSYRVRKMHNGKMINVTFDHKPKQKEILQAFAEKITENEIVSTSDFTFRQASEKYVDMKRNVLSPNTIREYSKTCDRLSDWFVGMKISDITQISINKQINELASNKSPKTVRNYHGFISAVLCTFRPEMKISTTLPQKVKNEPYTPSQDDVKRILEHEKDTEYYIPYVLACHGLRRGEILAIDPAKDIDGDILHINKSLAMNENKEWVIKSTKTTASTRDVVIPLKIAQKIQEQGYVYKGHPNTLTCHLRDLQTQLGIPHFGIHKFRHYFASIMSEKGVPDADIMALGGWETDYVMKSVYRHSMIEKEAQKKRNAMSKLQSSLF